MYQAYKTRVEEIVNLKKQMQDEFDSQFGNCIVNIIVSDNWANGIRQITKLYD